MNQILKKNFYFLSLGNFLLSGCQTEPISDISAFDLSPPVASQKTDYSKKLNVTEDLYNHSNKMLGYEDKDSYSKEAKSPDSKPIYDKIFEENTVGYHQFHKENYFPKKFSKR